MLHSPCHVTSYFHSFLTAITWHVSHIYTKYLLQHVHLLQHMLRNGAIHMILCSLHLEKTKWSHTQVSDSCDKTVQNHISNTVRGSSMSKNKSSTSAAFLYYDLWPSKISFCFIWNNLYWTTNSIKHERWRWGINSSDRAYMYDNYWIHLV